MELCLSDRGHEALAHGAAGSVESVNAYYSSEVRWFTVFIAGDSSRYDYIFFFFFQAEDGIRDYKVTGVQTCALPISVLAAMRTISSASVRRLRLVPLFSVHGATFSRTERHVSFAVLPKVCLIRRRLDRKSVV